MKDSAMFVYWNHCSFDLSSNNEEVDVLLLKRTNKEKKKK
jgi:hypothetical protein